MRAPIHWFRYGSASALAIAVLLLPAGAALGLALTVNSTADEPADNPSIATCISTPSGLCTLRAAIMVTNYFAGPHTIAVPAGTYTLTRPGYDDAALVGDLDIAHDVTIQGAGSALTIIDANGSVTLDRVFHVLSSVSNLTLSGMTVRNGQSLAGAAGSVIGGGGLYIEGAAQVQLSDVIVDGNTGTSGGGIYASFSSAGGSIAMNHVVVRNNTATDGGVGRGGGMFVALPSPTSWVNFQDSQAYGNTTDGLGGGLFVVGSTSSLLSINFSEIYSNTASSGGGIHNSAPVALYYSHVHDNHASVDGGAIEAFAPYSIRYSTLDRNGASHVGGAIFDLQEGSTSSEFGFIEQSTISDNGATSGGAIYHNASIVPGSQLVLVNSTVSGNAIAAGGTSAGGGGIFINGGVAYLLSSTIANNQVAFLAGLGGGLYIKGPADFHAQSSLIANNFHHGTAMQGPIPDDGYTNTTTGAVTGELTYDLIRTVTNFTITGVGTGSIFGQDPLLGPLQDNGGPTKTHALLAGSPAINAGTPTGCLANTAGPPLTMDQRGARRPFPAGGLCDIGAFEVNPPFTLDIDASNSATKYDALTDGLLVIRYMQGVTGTSLTTGALGPTATRNAADIAANLNEYHWALDIDGDGTVDVVTDGLLVLRYLFGMRSDALIQGALVPTVPRNTSALIESYLGTLTPP